MSVHLKQCCHKAPPMFGSSLYITAILWLHLGIVTESCAYAHWKLSTKYTGSAITALESARISTLYENAVCISQ